MLVCEKPKWRLSLNGLILLNLSMDMERICLDMCFVGNSLSICLCVGKNLNRQSPRCTTLYIKTVISTETIRLNHVSTFFYDPLDRHKKYLQTWSHYLLSDLTTLMMYIKQIATASLDAVSCRITRFLPYTLSPAQRSLPTPEASGVPPPPRRTFALEINTIYCRSLLFISSPNCLKTWRSVERIQPEERACVWH